MYVHVNQEMDASFEIGDKVPMLKLPSSVVTTSGDQFTLNIDPKTLPAKYVGADGNVTAEVVANDGRGNAGFTLATARVGGGSPCPAVATDGLHRVGPVLFASGVGDGA